VLLGGTSVPGWRSLFVGHFTVAYSYLVDGNQYRGEFYSSFEWEEGTDLPILYNLESPEESCVCDEDEIRAACEWVPGFLQDDRSGAIRRTPEFDFET
jgi:hypothetical protein